MATTELHAQASVWDHHGTRFAVLFLEGEAPDRSNGGVMLLPLLADVPLGLPEGWLRSAIQHGLVLLFAGYGLGLHEHADNGPAHPVDQPVIDHG